MGMLQQAIGVNPNFIYNRHEFLMKTLYKLLFRYLVLKRNEISLMNKGGKFLKKLWCCVGGGVLTRSFGIISTELKSNVNWPPLRVLKLTFRALALRSDEC